MTKLLNQAQLAALEPHYGHKHYEHKHTTRERLADVDAEIARWDADGKPSVWVIEEERDGFAAAVDFSYGLLALFRGDRCLGVGKQCVTTDTAVLLDTSHYGLPKYLWL